MTAANDLSQYITIRKLSEELACYSFSALRNLVAASATNGLEDQGAVLRKGRRVIVHRQRFQAWLDSHRSAVLGRG